MPPEARDDFADLLAVIQRLRAPDGCPWDRAQTTGTMGRHLLEEAFEAVDALRQGEDRAICDELGDVLTNVLLIAEIAAGSGRFDFAAVARAAREKLVRRHPHVFGDTEVRDAEDALGRWEAIKRSEGDDGPRGVLSGVPAALPALLRAFRIGEKAARVGFDWPDAAGPRAKVGEELAEVDEALARGDRHEIEAELGDLLLAVANLARHHGVEPETALRGTLDRFSARFAQVEATLGERLGSAGLAELQAAWDDAKRRERDRRRSTET